MSAKKPPPPLIWVSYCPKCGEPILADSKRHTTSCPLCPFPEPRGVLVRYRLAKERGR